MYWIGHIIQLIDTGTLHVMYQIRMPVLDALFMGATELGRSTVILGIAAIVSVFLIVKKRYSDVLGLIVSVTGTGAAVLFLKYAVARPRPDVLMQLVPEGPLHSFPSAHAGLAFALYGFLAYLLLQTYATKMRRIAIAALPALVILVGLSRLYLGVHYVSDVLVGYAIGAFFVWVGVRFRLQFLR